MKVRNALPVLERRASLRRGAPPDAADIALGVALGYVAAGLPQVEWRALPGLTRRCDEAEARPSFAGAPFGPMAATLDEMF